MSINPSLRQTPLRVLRHLLKRFLSSPTGGKIANMPPFSWMLRQAARIVTRRQLQQASGQPHFVEPVPRANLQATLDGIVHDVVEDLGYAVAMVATYEQGDIFPVRAFHIASQLASMEQVHAWESQISRFNPPDRPISLSDPEIARVYLYREEYQDNLCVRAARTGQPVLSDDLYSLFTPVAPLSSRPIVVGIQQELGIQQVIAVPFFLETTDNGNLSRELAGNLFAIKRSPISESDKLILTAFGRQAAAAILNERQRLQIQIAQRLVFDIQQRLHSEVEILQRIAEGVVADLGYVGCMVARYEPDDSLAVRAFYLDPNLATVDQIHRWESQISAFSASEHPITLDNPDVVKVYVHQKAYRDNLSVQAAIAGRPVVHDQLFSLFTPVVSHAARPIVEGIQKESGIQQVIAVPFFLETSRDSQDSRDFVGNLFAFTRSRRFSRGEIELLQAFGRQAAAGLNNARLYRQAQEQREAARIFARMAFSAATSVHTLRNHVGVIRGNLEFLERSLDQFPDQNRRTRLQKRSSTISERLDQIADLLETLHEPWRQPHDVQTDVNACLERALRKVISGGEDWIQLALTEDIPLINTSPDMLTEAFKVLIKNAVEAINEKYAYAHIDQHLLWIESCWKDQAIMITIRDSGIGIRPEHMSRVFEMRWTTKRTGLGFGLFWTQDFIQGLGGQIEVVSEWQKGTTFHVIIPAPVA